LRRRQPAQIGGDNAATESAAIVHERKIEVERRANPARPADLVDEILAAIAMNARARRQVHAIDVVCVDTEVERVGVAWRAPSLPAAADEAVAASRRLLFRGGRRRRQNERQNENAEETHIGPPAKAAKQPRQRR